MWLMGSRAGEYQERRFQDVGADDKSQRTSFSPQLTKIQNG